MAFAQSPTMTQRQREYRCGLRKRGFQSQLHLTTWQGPQLELPQCARPSNEVLPQVSKAVLAPNTLYCSSYQTAYLPFPPGSPFQSMVRYLQKLLVFFRLLLHQCPDLVVVVVCDGLFHGHRAGHGALLPKQGSSGTWNGQIQKVKDGVDTTGDGDQVRVCHLAPWGWVIPCCRGVSWTW